jgi:hypothetical protein
MYKIKIAEEAELDLEDAYNWYEKQVNQLGSDFIRAVDKNLAIIQKKPFCLSINLSPCTKKVIV